MIPKPDDVRCYGKTNGCTNLTTESKSCQAKGIKVTLTIGGASGSYYLTSIAEAK
ncbi:Glycoside hydrolase, catalytic domain-containing protein [Artemisia annua]|uniref:Glycoside hydrolase, catalytic domain-containing protein n=1 Tax=Artemisia annua TaxID=35608 RepID=A0A2U1MQ29_ARTAN|nr:Glycoside hydrolase, catalytic domain-containing protein [Artemisia annua]